MTYTTLTRFRHKIPLLSGKFRYPGRHVLGGQATLYGDRIDLQGWGRTGRFQRQIPLVRLIDMDFHPLDKGGNLTLLLDNGEEVPLIVENAHRWRLAFENWLSYHVLASAKILPESDHAYAIAG